MVRGIRNWKLDINVNDILNLINSKITGGVKTAIDVTYTAATGLFNFAVRVDDSTIVVNESNSLEVGSVDSGNILYDGEPLSGVIDYLTGIPELTQEPSGFIDNTNDYNTNISVSYDAGTRKVTLSGDFLAVYKGAVVEELVNGWVSEAHPAGKTVNQYLYYREGAFYWSDTIFDFNDLWIAILIYDSSNTRFVCQREVHGLMPWQSHQAFHKRIGTIRDSGGELSDYTLNSTTATNRRPLVSATTLYDEDLSTTVTAISNETNAYTKMCLTGTGTPSFVADTADIAYLSTNQPYYNQYTGGAWQQTLLNDSEYMAIWLVATPVGSDSVSQKYRYLWIQGQKSSLSLSQIQALYPLDVSLGTFADLFNEAVFIAKVIIRYIGGNWQIVQVDSLTGSRAFQVASPAGSYLSSVSTDDTIDGIGALSNPLSIQNSLDTKQDVFSLVWTEEGNYNPDTQEGDDNTSGFSDILDTWITQGGQLVIPSGSYQISSRIAKTLSASKTYELVGVGDVKFYYTGSETTLYDAVIDLTGTKASTILKIKNIELVGNSTDRGTTSGLKVKNVHRYYEENVKTSYFSWCGRWFDSIDEFTMWNPVALHNCYAGCSVRSIGAANQYTSNVWGGDFSYNGRTSGAADGDYGFAIQGVGVTSYNINFYGTNANYNLRKGFDNHSGQNIKYSGCNAIGTGYTSGTATTQDAFGFYSVNEVNSPAKDTTYINCTADGTSANAVTRYYEGFSVGSYDTGATNSGKFTITNCFVQNIDYPTITAYPVWIASSGDTENLVKEVIIDNITVSGINCGSDTKMIRISTYNAENDNTYNSIRFLKVINSTFDSSFCTTIFDFVSNNLIFMNNTVTTATGSVTNVILNDSDAYCQICNNYFNIAGTITNYFNLTGGSDNVIQSNFDINGDLLPVEGVNFFDQDLNTTDAPTFTGITINATYGTIFKKLIYKPLTNNTATKILSISTATSTWNILNGNYVVYFGQYSTTKSAYSGCFKEPISIGNNHVYLADTSPCTIYPIAQSCAIYPTYGETATITFQLIANGADTAELWVTVNTTGGWNSSISLDLEITGTPNYTITV